MAHDLISVKAALGAYPPIEYRVDQLMSTDGAGGGTTEMTVATPTKFYYTPPGNRVATLERMLVYVEDNAKFAGGYGGAAALTNGLMIHVEDENGRTIHDFTPNTIKKNGHWGLLAGVDVIVTDVSAGNDFMLVRWTFGRAGAPLVLNGLEGEKLVIHVQDAMNTLVSHLCVVQGYISAPDGS